MTKTFAITSRAPQQPSRVALIRTITPATSQVSNRVNQLTPSAEKFTLFWNMMSVIKVHSYLRAAMGAIGRAVVGPWFDIVRTEGDKSGTKLQRKKLLNFYNSTEKRWDNIQDYYSVAYKFMVGAMYLRYFGQTAYKINRNMRGDPIGFDHLPGLVVPNTDSTGKFKKPAFVQYLSANPADKTEYETNKDIIYITNPDWNGSTLGASDIEALAEFTLPLDLYLQTAARSYLENSAKPEVVYMLPPDVSEEAFNAFVNKMNEKYTGAKNAGRNPIAIQGDLKILRVDDMPNSVPYQDARGDTRNETLAVSGTGAALLGVSDSLSSANIRETRRQFHESSMLPLLRFLQQAFYEQAHVRQFNIVGWSLRFNNPDFLTAVERATVHMRYTQMGVMSVNEVRKEIGLDPVPGGDELMMPAEPQGISGQPTGQRAGEQQADDSETPSDSGDSRGDQHDTGSNGE